MSSYIFNSSSKEGVGVQYAFSYNGTPVAWAVDRLGSMSTPSITTEALSDSLDVGNLDVSFIDTDGAIFNYLGNGTSALSSVFSGTAFFGGEYTVAPIGPTDQGLVYTSATGAGSYVFHKGQITQVSRSGRITSISSENVMSRLATLSWRFPIYPTQVIPDRILGSFVFFNSDLTLTGGSTAFFGSFSDGTQFHVYAFVGTVNGSLASSYPTPAGRGTMGVISPFFFPGTQFYTDFNRQLYNGTFYATKYGTIDTDQTATQYGFLSTDEAGSFNVGGGGEATYIINKTSLEYSGATYVDYTYGSAFAFQQAAFTLGSDPMTLWNEMLTGCCVDPVFSGTDIDQNSLATAKRISAFQYFSQTIPPAGGQILPYIKDLLAPLTSLFSVDTQNHFRINLIGPKNLTDVVYQIGSSEIIDSSYSVSTDDRINHIIFDYGWNVDQGSFANRLEVYGSGWTINNESMQNIQCQWLSNTNNAVICMARMLKRFQYGVPRLTITTPLSQIGLDIGSLAAITDKDIGLSGHIFEVTGWRKDITKGMDCSFDMMDGDALYRQAGYAFWEDGTTKQGTVSGTSTSGWGSAGTVHNINGTFFGPKFVWF